MNNKVNLYQDITSRIKSLLSYESDEVAMMATIVCELHQNLPHFDWTGFYRVTTPDTLVIGPYQGTHGCLRIPFSKGVCGKAARTKNTQLVADVSEIEDHIACSASTKSEIVVPIFSGSSKLLGVLDVDSNAPSAFDETDKLNLEAICQIFSKIP